jgi:hypothetical protein
LKASNVTSSPTAPPANQRGNGDSSSSPAERFTLTGPSILLDPRIHAFRSDLADIALAGQLFAPHYARPVIRRCGLQPADAYCDPSDRRDALYRLAPGEEFALLDVTGRWAWGYRRADHQVGYVLAEQLAEPAAAAVP